MNKSRFFIFSIVAVLLFTFPTAALRAQSQANQLDDELLKMIPADSLFVARVNNFEYTLGQIDQFLSGASPMPMAASMLIRMQLASLLGDPALNNVSMSGSFVFFGIAGSSETPQVSPLPPVFLAGLFPISDFEQFTEQNQSCSKPDNNGIAAITSANMAGNVIEMLIMRVGNSALMASKENYDQLLKTAQDISDSSSPAIAQQLDASEIQKATTEPIWLYGNIPVVSQAFGDMLSQQFNMAKAMMQQNQPEMQNAIMGLDIQQLLEGIKFLSLAINPKPNVCSITETIGFVPSSEIEPMFAPDSPMMQQILQGINAQKPEQIPDQIQQISSLIPNAEKADFVGEYNLSDLQKMAAASAPMLVPQLDLTTESNIVFALDFASDRINVQIAVPKELLTEVTAVSMALQQQTPQMQPEQFQSLMGEDMDQPPLEQETVVQIQPAIEQIFTFGPIIDINGLQFGMTTDQMKEILGEPKSQTGNVYYYLDSGLIIMTSTQDLVEEIICGSINPDSPLVKNSLYRTNEDIGIGSSRQQVISVYDQPSMIHGYPYVENAATLEYEKINARFTIINDKVVQMIFRTPRK